MSNTRGYRKITAAERAKHEAQLQSALAWPSFPEPKALDEAERDALLSALPTPMGYGFPIVSAWTCHVGLNELTHGCFSRTGHSTRSSEKADSQGQGGPWYRTAVEAAQALQWNTARHCAEILLRSAQVLAKVEDRPGA